MALLEPVSKWDVLEDCHDMLPLCPSESLDGLEVVSPASF